MGEREADRIVAPDVHVGIDEQTLPLGIASSGGRVFASPTLRSRTPTPRSASCLAPSSEDRQTKRKCASQNRRSSS